MGPCSSLATQGAKFCKKASRLTTIDDHAFLIESYNSVAASPSSMLSGRESFLKVAMVSLLILPNRISFNIAANSMMMSVKQKNRYGGIH